MKFIVSGILIGIVAIVVTIALRGLKPSEEAFSPGPSMSSSRFVVAVLSSEVSIKGKNESDFKEIEKEGEITEGSEIKTSKTGRASVLYPNGTIANLAGGTSFMIKSLSGEGEQSRLHLFVGGIWSKIENVLNKGDYYEIETENMVASVRGTEFNVTFLNGISVIEVFENKVNIQAIDPQTGQSIEGGFIELFAGEKVSVDSANLPSKNNPLKKVKVVSPTPKATLRPSALSSPTPSSIIFTPTPASIQTISAPKQTPTPTPAPVPNTVITSITPSKIQKSSGSVSFYINGEHLGGSKAVFLNFFELQFVVIDSFTIFSTAGPNIEPGIYDVSVTAGSGEKLTLYRALEIQTAQ